MTNFFTNFFTRFSAVKESTERSNIEEQSLEFFKDLCNQTWPIALQEEKEQLTLSVGTFVADLSRSEAPTILKTERARHKDHKDRYHKLCAAFDQARISDASSNSSNQAASESLGSATRGYSIETMADLEREMQRLVNTGVARKPMNGAGILTV